MTDLTGSLAVRRGRVAISAAFFAQGFVFAIVLTHLGAFEEAWDSDDLGITVIMFSVAVFAAVGSVVAGMLSARWGSATALRAGLIGIAVAVGAAAGLAAAGELTVPYHSSSSPQPAPVIPWKTVSILGAAIVLFYIVDSATQSWSTIYLHDVLAASVAVAPLGYAAYQAASLVSRGFGDLLVRRFGPGGARPTRSSPGSTSSTTLASCWAACSPGLSPLARPCGKDSSCRSSGSC